MTTSPKSYCQPAGNTVLLPIRPKYSALIYSGSKRIELRRIWAKSPIDTILIYTTAPTSAVTGWAKVLQVIKLPADQLWTHASELGGALSRDEFNLYFAGRDEAVGVVIGDVHEFDTPLKLRQLTGSDAAPQSFRYVSPSELDQSVRHRSGRCVAC